LGLKRVGGVGETGERGLSRQVSARALPLCNRKGSRFLRASRTGKTQVIESCHRYITRYAPAQFLAGVEHA
jgi:hypothetical protein